MFKNQIVYYLNKYLGEYVYGLDAESLRISLWQGDVELRNLQLKPEALRSLDLPIAVKSGLLGRLTLKVPWNKLGQEPVVAEFDRLYIVAGPNAEEDGSTPAPAPAAANTAAAVKQAELAAKQKRIYAAEQDWVKNLQEQEMLAKLQGTQGSGGAGDKGSGGAGPGGRIQALIDTVIGNLELRISNIHIRYEDPVSNPGQTFAVGLLLSEVSAHTVDDRGRRAFVKSDALLTLRKGVDLQSLSVYFDCGAAPLEPPQPWQSLPLSSWDDLLLPAKHLPSRNPAPADGRSRSSSPLKQLTDEDPPRTCRSGSPTRAGSPSRFLMEPSALGSSSRQGLASLLPAADPPPTQEHQYLLAPVDGTLLYTRRGVNARHTEQDAHQEMQLQLRSISLQLHQQQYVSAQKLLQEFDRYAASAPHRHLRPNCHPSPGVGCRLWWRYAIGVVQRQQQRQHCSWQQLKKVTSIRRQYVPYYVKLLQQGKQGGDATVAAWDAELDESAALLFRRMAHAKYVALKQKPGDGATQPGAPGRPQQQQQGWLGWLWGSTPQQQAARGASPGPAAGKPEAGGLGEPEQPVLDASEWAALDQLLTEQEVALKKGDTDTPYTVLLRLAVAVDVAAVQLQDGTGHLLMQGSLDGVQGDMTSYPSTTDVRLKMAMFGIHSRHGPLVSSGLLTAAATDALQQQQQRKALDLHYVRQPQDGTADVQVTVKLAPSYVTYKQAAITEVQSFFSSGEQQLELSALQAQAAGRADKLRRMAQTQLNAMSKRNAAQKPRLQLKMTLNAPKVAIPSADGNTTLLADLGCFMFDSDPTLLSSLTAEEAAVYECFSVKVDHVSAYLMEGPFAWPSAEELLEGPARTPGSTPIAAARTGGSTGAPSQQQQAGLKRNSSSTSLGKASKSSAATAVVEPPCVSGEGVGRGSEVRRVASSLIEALGRRGKLVTLLERFGAGMDLQVATSMHPRYPVLRLAVNASPIRLHLSPYRYQHLMNVLMSMGQAADDATAAASVGPSKPLWLTDAEYSTKVSTLTADTMVGALTSGGSAARWTHKRWLHVWRGRVYITQHTQDTEVLLTKTYWRGYKVVLVPPAVLKGDDNAVAILPQGVKVDALAECSDALVLRVRDATAAAELRKKLVQSASQMSAVAGLLQMSDVPEESSSVGTTHDVFEELLSHQLLLELSGTIPEVQLLVGGRAPVHWWPPSSSDGAAGAAGSTADSFSLHSGGSSADIDAEVGAAAGIGSTSGRSLHAPSSTSSFGRSGAGGLGPGAAAQHAGAGGGPGGSSSSSSWVSLDQEVDLVAIRFLGARLNFALGGDGMRVDAVMRALQVDDLLVGARNPGKAHLARSEVVGGPDGALEEALAAAAAAALSGEPSQGSLSALGASEQGSVVEDEEEDEFYDAEEGPSTPRNAGRGSRRSSGAGSTASGPAQATRQASVGPAAPLRAPSLSSGLQGDLVRMCFVRFASTSSRYTGTDVELVLQLSTLVFYCHRPTVAALMVFGTDLGAISAQLGGPEAAEQPSESPSTGDEAAAGDSSSLAETDSVATTQLMPSGGETRTMFKLALLVSKVELHMDYEGFTTESLAIGAMQDFAFHLSVHPATLSLTASLGNLVAEYGALPPGHTNRTILTMREGTSGSLINLVFKLHSQQESFTEPRVPSGLPFMSVNAQLSTVQVVFMQRFLNEFLAYLAVMFAMQPPPRVLPTSAPPAATTGQGTASNAASQAAPQPAPTTSAGPDGSSTDAGAASMDRQSGSAAGDGPAEADAAAEEPPAAPAAANPLILLLDVVLEAPVIVMPLRSGSEDQMEVDLGTLEVSNRVMWEVKGQGAAQQRLLLDQLQVTLKKVSGCVTAGGVRGRNVIRDLGSGILVHVVRPIVAEPLPAPPISIAVEVPQLRLSLLDSEYSLILEILAANFSEQSALPPEVAYLHQKLLAVGGTAGDGGTADVAATAAGQLPAAGGAPTAAAASISEADQQPGAELGAKRDAVRRFTSSNAQLLQLLDDVCVSRVTVKISHAQLMLWNRQPDGSAPLPLGCIELSSMWLMLNNTRQSNFMLSLSLPVVCARDLRPGVPLEASLVLSTAEMGSAAGAPAADPAAATTATADSTAAAEPGSTGAAAASQSASGAAASLLPSLLTLEFRAVKSLGPEMVSGLQVRLQRPTLVLDIGFIMQVLHFVVPSVGTQGPQSRPYITHEVHLGPTPYLADSHLWLSPQYRIVADAPGVKEFVYDGRGHALVLPAGLPATEHVPLIVVGRNKTLRLRNVKVANCGALAAVLDLGAGARLIAEESEGVKLVDSEEELALGKRFQRFMSTLRANQRASVDPSSTSGTTPAAAAPAAVPATMDIHVSAVGAAVYLVDAHGGSGATPGTTGAWQPAAAADTGRVPSASAGPHQRSKSMSEGVRLAAGAGPGGDPEGAELLYMLAVALDLGLEYQMRPDFQQVHAELLNLCVKAQARVLEDPATLMDQVASDGDPAAAAAVVDPASSDAAAAGGTLVLPSAARQSVAVNILDPCNLVVSTRLAQQMQAISVEMSELRVKLSPDVLQLISHLQKVVLQPLVVPPPTAPVVRCSSFECLWSSYDAGTSGSISGPFATAGAGGVDVMSNAKGVTLWRPQPPMGYASLGDVLTAGATQPDHQALVVAINSGLVAYPVGYTRVWSSLGVALWRPNPPPGYFALGCIATLCGQSNGSSSSSSSQPPPLKAMVVVAQQAAVEALAGQCMLLTSAGNLWSIQNSAATFEVSAPDGHCPAVRLYDLRSPLGVSPAALAAAPPAAEGEGLVHLAGQVQVPPSLLAARRFKAQRAQLRAAISSAGQVTHVVEFDRIWWDKYAKHPTDQGVSFWRPRLPPGYVALGDVVSPGHYAPPSEVLVVRDTGHHEGLTGPPPLTHPLTYKMVWQDDHKRALRDPNYLCLWEPIPQPGYVVAGMVATTGGGSMPPTELVRCLRADLAAKADPSNGVVFSSYKERQPLRCWVLDERCGTFCIGREGEDRPSGAVAWRLRPDVDRDAKEAGRPSAVDQAGAAAAVAPKRDITVRLKRLNLLLRNMLRTPVLELEATGPGADVIKLGVFSEPTGVTRGFAELASSIWSYHRSLEVWEPVVTPWQLLMKVDHNPCVISCEGVAPGTQVDIKSTGGAVHVTLAHAAINSMLNVLGDWQVANSSASSGSNKQAAARSRAGLVAADGLTVDTVVNNTLDEAAFLQLDFGDQKEVVALPAHGTVSIRQPVPQVPQSHAPVLSQLVPPVRLLVDVLEGRMPAGLAAAGSTPELFVKVELAGMAAAKASTTPWPSAGQPLTKSRSGAAFAAALAQSQLGADTWGLTSRALAAETSSQAGAQQQQQQAGGAPSFSFPWRERFMVTLPQNLAEHLLSPAPGDNQFAGLTDELRVSVWDATAHGGVGGMLASGVVQLQYSWLEWQLRTAMKKRLTESSLATAAEARPGPAGLQRQASQLGSCITLRMPLMGSTAASSGAGAGAGLEAAGAEAAPCMELKLQLKLDDSQVDLSWHPKRRQQQQAALVAAAAVAAQGGAAGGPAAADMSPQGQTRASTQATRHALRLADGQVWCPFSYSNMQRTPGGLRGQTAVLPIKGIARGLALEVEYAVGAYQLQLRSLCCFINDTDMPLEVALLEDSDSSWTMVPTSANTTGTASASATPLARAAAAGAARAAASGSSSVAATPKNSFSADVAEERMFEFERYMPLTSPSWSHDYLLPTDPARWSLLPKGGRSSSERPLVALPQGWEWEGPWEVEHHPCVDSEGWAYALDFMHLHWPPEVGDGSPKSWDVVRRRAWVRRRRRTALPSTVLDVSSSGQQEAAGGSPASKVGQGGTEVGDGWTRRVLGVVLPGQRLPLPHNWQRGNSQRSKQLQMRPVVGQAALAAAAEAGGAAKAASHSWSYGASYGHHSVLLSELEDGETRLLCCKTLAASQSDEASAVLSPKRATAHAPAAWLAAVSECTPLRLPGGLETLSDWRVIVRPPLHLVNQLPVAAHYQLWEGATQGIGGRQLRQQGRLEGGQAINVYSVDMRRQIYLTFYPEGGQWAERAPALISGGFQSDSAGMSDGAGVPQLPGSCLVNYSNSSSTMGLRIAINRELDQELVDSQRMRMAASRAAAAGTAGAAGAAAAAAAAVQRAAAQNMGEIKLSFGGALAQGRVLTLRLSVPAWVVNGTQVPVTLGLVPVLPETIEAGTALVSEARMTAEGTGRSDSMHRRRSRVSAAASASGVTVLDACLPAGLVNPVAVLTVMPNSVELLSAPDVPLSEGQDPIRWAAAISMAGSKWTKAVPLLGGVSGPAGNTEAAAVANAAATAGSAVEGSLLPLLVRAMCSDNCLHEVTAQVQTSGTGLQAAAVLTVAPRIIVSNRTGYPLLLLQTEPLRQAMSAATAISSSYGQQAMAMGGYGGPAGSPMAYGGGGGAWFPGGAAPLDPAAVMAAQRMAAGMAGYSAKLKRPGLDHPAVTLVRPGTVGLPLAWQPGAAERQLAVMLPPVKAAQGGPLDPLMWSAPFTVQDNMERLQLLLPAYRLGTPGEPQKVDEVSLAAAQQELQRMVLPAAKEQLAPAGASSGQASGTASSSSSGSSATVPLLVQMQKDMEAGMQGYLAVVLALRVEERGVGCLHLVLESLGGEPELVIQNCLPAPLCYRQDTSTAAWQQLPPLSAAGLVLQQPPGAVPGMSAAAAPAVVEVRDANPATSGSGSVQLDDPAGVGGSALPAAFTGRGQGDGSRRGADTVFKQELAVGNKHAIALVSSLYESIMGEPGPQEVPGGSGAANLGHTVTDRLLRVVPKQGFVSAHQLQLAAALSGMDRSRASPASHLALNLEVGLLDISLVDARPRELLLVSVDGLTAAARLGNTLGVPYQAAALRIASIQVDDMSQATPFPVLLTSSTSARRNSSGGCEGGPALQLELVMQPERIKGLMYIPTLVFRVAPVQLSLPEALVWKLLDFGSSLTLEGGSGGSMAGGTVAADRSMKQSTSYSHMATTAGAQQQQQVPQMASGGSSSNLAAPGGAAVAQGGGSRALNQPGHHQQVAASADVPLYVNLLSLDEVKFVVNIRADRLRRPRWAAAKFPILATLGDLLTVDGLEVTLPELEFENERLLRSRLVQQLTSQMQGQLLGIVFGVLRSYGALGAGVRFMSVVGNIMQTSAGVTAQSSSSTTDLSNVGQALIEGGKTFGKSLLQGVTGIVTNPLEGAEKAGLLGFAKGVGKGIMGVPMAIGGGALSAAAQVAEGLDAGMSQLGETLREQLGAVDDKLPRRRLPRAIRGDRVLTVYERRPAAGQSLLFTCGPVLSQLQMRGGGVRSGLSFSSEGKPGLAEVEDAYEYHEVLEGGDVLLLTNARVLLVSAEGFAAIQDNHEVNKVPPAAVQWQLTWDQLLTTELYFLPAAPRTPAGVLLHRRQRDPAADNTLVNFIRCWGPPPTAPTANSSSSGAPPASAAAAAQAVRLQQAVVATRSRYYLTPRREAQGWSAVPVTAVEQQPNQAMPDTVPCIQYKQVWVYNKPGRRAITVWRPQGPPGYWPLGDVAVPGQEPPAAPVKVYRGAAAPGSSSSRRPPLAPPNAFQLLFRDSRSGFLVTIWRPVPPTGYVDLGCVVWPAIDEPPLECVRCLRQDLVRVSRFYDSPLWEEASGDNQEMRCALWQVDNTSSTFVAVKGTSRSSLRPAQGAALAPMY